MKDWYIEDHSNIIYVLHGERYISKKRIYPDDNQKSPIEFYLLYNEEYRTVGYQLNYKWTDKCPKFITYNSFGIVYSKKRSKNIFLEVLFEDANVRLLAYQHESGIRDYFLVGRWRNPTSKDQIIESM